METGQIGRFVGRRPDIEDIPILADGEVNLALNIEGIIFYKVEIEGERCDEDKDECKLKFKIGALNKSNEDYKYSATIMLLGGGGKVLVSKKEVKSIEEDEDLHGAVVNLAARIVAEAEPGQVLVSDAARQLLVGKPYTFEPVGSRYVKGFDDAIALYEVARRS